MGKRALLLLTLAGLYLYVKHRRDAKASWNGDAAEADWADEGGREPSAAVESLVAQGQATLWCASAGAARSPSGCCHEPRCLQGHVCGAAKIRKMLKSQDLSLTCPRPRRRILPTAS